MRKFLIMIVFAMIGSFMASAELYNVHAYKYAQKTSSERKYSSPINCDIDISIDTTNNFINVGTARTQYYVIMSYDNSYIDDDGDLVIRFNCIDEEGISCRIRFIKQRSGIYHLYIDYRNISWVYQVR